LRKREGCGRPRRATGRAPVQRKLVKHFAETPRVRNGGGRRVHRSYLVVLTGVGDRKRRSRRLVATPGEGEQQCSRQTDVHDADVSLVRPDRKADRSRCCGGIAESRSGYRS
jgi:hypothetical protein